MKKLEYKVRKKVEVLGNIANKLLEQPKEDLEIKENDGMFYIEFDITEEEFNKLPKGIKKHLN